VVLTSTARNPTGHGVSPKLSPKPHPRKRHKGLNFPEIIGRLGGRISRGGPFATNRELAVEAGRKGGKAPRRKKQVES